MAKRIVKSVIPDQAESTSTGADPLDNSMKIDELRLLKMTRALEKERASRMELQLVVATLNGMVQQWLAQNEEAKKLNDKVQELQAEQKAAQKTYQDIVTEVGKEFGIDMKNYSFDDETGVLHELPPKEDTKTPTAEAAPTAQA